MKSSFSNYESVFIKLHINFYVYFVLRKKSTFDLIRAKAMEDQ